MRCIIALGCLIVMLSCEKKQERLKTGENQYSTQRVFDEVKELTQMEADTLTTMMLKIEHRIGPQLAIVILDTLHGKPIQEVSRDVFLRLKLGSPKKNDGLLILQSVKDREIRIEVGLGLELIIKDEIAARINRELIVPKFKENKFYEGFYLGINKIGELIAQDTSLIGQHL